MSAKLTEKRNELQAKQTKITGILTAAKQATGGYDFTNVAELEGETSELKAEKFEQLTAELDVLAKEVTELSIQEKAERVAAIGERLKAADRGDTPIPDGMRTKSLGTLFVESDGFKGFHDQAKGKGSERTVAVAIDVDLKQLFETGQGWAPEAFRTGKIVEAPVRPIQVQDLIPSGTVDAAAVTYLEETLVDENAAERAEGAEYSEDGYELIERTAQVRNIGTSIPVTDEVLEDVNQVRAYIDSRLLRSCQRRLDGQLLNGNGTAPNLRGINNVVGIQTQAKGSLPIFDAFLYAMTKVQTIGQAAVTGIAVNPVDWQDIRLTRTADGIYIMGNPADPGPRTLFGAAVSTIQAQAQNTGILGDFQEHSFLWIRRGVVIEVGYVGNQFKEGKRTIRARQRAAFVVYRPSAFCTVTGI